LYQFNTMEKNLINEAPKKSIFDFVDHIRCLAIMAIVAEHSLAYGRPLAIHSNKYWVFVSLIQFLRFGIVTFFMLSGFLLGDKFTAYTSGQYLTRRFKNTFGPWLFWSGVYVLCFIINLRVKERIYHDGSFSLPHILDGIKTIYLYTNYWFVLNFMISITILLIFKRYIYTWVMGGVLLGCTLFYSINVHTKWTSTSHTTAILGFIFFLWLGVQLRKYWPQVNKVINSASYICLILLVLLTYALAYYEMDCLISKNDGEPYNTLRITNMLYSLAVFALLLKIRTIKVLNFLKPRQTTFGIYLIHYIILAYLAPEILRPLHIEVENLEAAQYFGYKLLFFILVYTITMVIVRLINKTKARRLVGN
jgi:hypothetical protein